MHNAILINNFIMRNIHFFIKVLIVYLFITSNSLGAKSDSFSKGIEHFNKKEFDKSKIFFERDIVFNPKNEKSYLYLAKIFFEEKNNLEEEINLNNVLLINPNNDEAIYMLINLKIEQSDYEKAKELIERFSLVCNLFCSKKNEINKKFEKLIPENEKNNN